MSEDLNGSMWDLPITICPELVAAAFKKKEADLYICWVIFKAFDSVQNNSGHRTMNNMLYIFEHVLGLNKTQAYAKISKGVGTYWNKPNGPKGAKTTSLISKQKVYQYLQPTMTKTQPFGLKLKDFVCDNEQDGGWKYVKGLLIALVAARFPDTRPTTYATIQEHTGLSESTIRRHLYNCPHVHIIKNSNIVMSHVSYSYLHECLEEMIKGHRQNNPYFIMFKDGLWHIMQQMANSYAVSEFERISYKNRARELKSFDKGNYLTCSERRYFLKMQNMKKAKNSTDTEDKFISTGYTQDQDKGYVWIWEKA